MNRILLSVIAVATSMSTYAQGVVFGIEPASIQQNFEFAYGDVGNSWGANDFHTNSIIAPAIYVEDGTVGTDMNGDPFSQRGCNTLTNAADIAGKIALVRRGECDFGLKALKAQQAGAVAVIIVNNTDENFGILGGDNGLNVTVPVLCIRYSLGQMLSSALAQGEIELLLGNKNGRFETDLAVYSSDLVSPDFLLYSSHLGAINAPLGMVVRNLGSAAVTNAVAKIEVVGADATVVYTHSFDEVSIAAGDSIFMLPISAQSFPNLEATLAVGEYTIRYSFDTEGEDFPADNISELKLRVSDDAWSWVQLGATETMTETMSFTRPVSPQPTSEQLFCSTFRHENASAVAVTGFNYAVTLNEGSLEGRTVAGHLFAWNDPFVNIDDIAIDNLQEVAFGEYFFQENGTAENFRIAFDEPVVLQDNQRYLACIASLDTSLFYAFSSARDIKRNKEVDNQPATMLNSEGWYVTGFGTDVLSALQLSVIAANTVSTTTVSVVEGMIFPNPVKDIARIKIAKDGDATVSVTDLSGRTVSTQSVSFVANDTIVDLSTLTNGMYIINVTFKDGVKSTFNVIKG